MQNKEKRQKKLKTIIVQGKHNEIQTLFNDIFELLEKEFYEDNLPTLIDYMLELTMNSWRGKIKKMYSQHHIYRATEIERLLRSILKDRVDKFIKNILLDFSTLSEK